MSIVAVLSRDRAVRSLPATVETVGAVASTRVSGRLLRLVRERPVTTVLVDGAVFAEEWEPELLVRELGRRFPSVGTVFLDRGATSMNTLLGLGRLIRDGQARLSVIRMEEVRHGLARSLARASEASTRSAVLRAVGNRLAGRERGVLGAAMDAALLGWGAEDLAAHAGWTRPHLSERLRAAQLPSTGALLLWARTLHAARWLPEPGRTAESVSRQLGYANGATFRRALRNVLGVTPTALVAAGGFDLALRRFLDECGLGDSVRDDRSVA